MNLDTDASPRLPPLLVLTDRKGCERAGRTLLDTVHHVVDAGATTIVFREKDLPSAERARLAAELRAVVPCLIVASDIDTAMTVGADGVHLASGDPWPNRIAAGDPDAPPIRRGHRSSGDPRYIIGRSCHDDAGVRQAVDRGASYVTVSPVFPTPSKPGYGPPLGLDALADHVTRHPGVLMYALGGVAPGRAAHCIEAGAAGVAVMGAVMAAEDPGDLVRHLIAELDRVVAS